MKPNIFWLDAGAMEGPTGTLPALVHCSLRCHSSAALQLRGGSLTMRGTDNQGLQTFTTTNPTDSELGRRITITTPSPQRHPPTDHSHS